MVASFKQVLVSLATVLLMGLGVAPGDAAATGNARASAADPTSWTVRPAPGQYGAGRSLFGYTLNAGDELTDRIDIANTSTAPITLEVYAADASTTDSGDLDVLPDDEGSTDLGVWVKPADSRVTIAAGQQVRVPFSVSVPADATPGDHVGGIVTVLDQKPAANGGAVVHQRNWLGIKVRVSGELAPRLAIEDVKLDLTGTSNPFGTGVATLSYTVHNTGNTVLGGLPKVTVAGALGRSPKTIDGERLPDLLPGERWNARVRVDDVFPMPWVSGEVTVTPVLTDAAGSTSTLAPVTVADRSFVSIWSFGVVLVLLLMLASTVWLLIRRVKRSRDASDDDADTRMTS